MSSSIEMWGTPIEWSNSEALIKPLEIGCMPGEMRLYPISSYNWSAKVFDFVEEFGPCTISQVQDRLKELEKLDTTCAYRAIDCREVTCPVR